MYNFVHCSERRIENWPALQIKSTITCGNDSWYIVIVIGRGKDYIGRSKD